MTGRTGLMGQENQDRTALKGLIAETGQSTKVSLQSNLQYIDDNIKHKVKVITQADDNPYVTIQPMITTNVQDTHCYHPAT
jgi:hypothetical protein